jgi:hypothetical protein
MGELEEEVNKGRGTGNGNALVILGTFAGVGEGQCVLESVAATRLDADAQSEVRVVGLVLDFGDLLGHAGSARTGREGPTTIRAVKNMHLAGSWSNGDTRFRYCP